MQSILPKDLIRNSVIWEQASVKVELLTRVEKSILSWFGHVERMDQRRSTNQIYVGSVNGCIVMGSLKCTFCARIGDVLVKGPVKGRGTRNRRAFMKSLYLPPWERGITVCMCKKIRNYQYKLIHTVITRRDIVCKSGPTFKIKLFTLHVQETSAF